MFDRVAALSERVERLERRLGQNSRNSSLAPSSDRPDRENEDKGREPRRRRSGKKRGAQQGHKGSGRRLDPNPDEVVEHRPGACRRCGRQLDGGERTVGRPARHQVIELPDSAVVTTGHRLLRVVCTGCGTHSRAEPPAGVEQGAFGPGLRATIVTLAVMLMSRRTTLALLGDMFGARISVGSIETSWRRAGQRIWLWAALSASACCFRIDPTRARSAAKALLGDFDGLLISDRYSVYDFIEPGRRQACLAHLARTFQAFAERDGPAGRHGRAIRQLIDEVIRADTQARRADERICWADGELNTLHDRLMDAVEAGERCRTPELSRLCATILTYGPPCGTSPTTPPRRRPTTAASGRSDTPSCGARQASAPSPRRATDSSNGSSRSARPVASTTTRCTTTSCKPTTADSPAPKSRSRSRPPRSPPDHATT